MSRGGRRERRIYRGDAAVWCPGGKWGPRRTRVTECYSTLRAEVLYTALLKNSPAKVGAGAQGTATYTIAERSVTAQWEIRANAVWRCGRVFFRCSPCKRLCTRLYIPLEHSLPACRRCWGLSYVSRGLLNYKDSIWGRGPFARLFNTSQRDYALMRTHDRRQERKLEAAERWTERRKLIRKAERLKLALRVSATPSRRREINSG